MQGKAAAVFDLKSLLGFSAVILDAIPQAMFLKAQDGTYLWANKAWADLMGLDRDRIAGNFDGALFPPELALACSEPDRRVLVSRGPASKTLFLQKPGRPKRHVQLTAAPIFSPDGQIAGIVGLARELAGQSDNDRPWDERGRYQDAVSLCTRSLLMSRATETAVLCFLRHLGELNRVQRVALFENFSAPDGERCVRRRYEWAETGHTRHDPNLPESIAYAPWLVRWHLLLSTGLPVQGTIETLPPQESAILAEEDIRSVLLLPLEVDGRFWGFVRLADCRAARQWQDTEVQMLSVAAESLGAFLMRVQSEEALRRKIEEQEALWAGSPDGLYIKDKDSVYLAANPALAELLGVPEDEIPGKTDFDFYPTAEATKFRSEDRKVIESGETLRNLEDTLTAASGRTLQTITTKVPLRDSAGAVIGMIGLTRDLTEHVELERQVRQAQKMESVGTLAAGIAHDFNNLLTSILGFAHLMLPKLERGSSLGRYIERIIGAGTRAKDLIRQLLTFSRQVEAKKEPMLLAPILKETVKFLRSTLPTSIEIVSDFPQRLPHVEADPTQMHQVVMNLCVNAGHAMPGGGTLTVCAKSFELDELADADGGTPRRRQWVQLTIEDTGRGMDEATQARIFEPFFTTKGAGEGTGLGLSTVYGIVKDCNGTIEVNSVPGKGTVFRLRFPATDAALRHEQPPPSPPARHGNETVLFVDDEPDVVELGQATLEEAGYTVLTALDGAQALSLYERHLDEIDLLVTDTSMPRMSGPQLIGHVLALRPDAKIVLCSGKGVSDGDRRTVEETGGTILPKPFIPNEILTVARRVLGG